MLVGGIGSVVSVRIAGPRSLYLVALVSVSLVVIEHSKVGFGRVSGCVGLYNFSRYGLSTKVYDGRMSPSTLYWICSSNLSSASTYAPTLQYHSICCRLCWYSCCECVLTTEEQDLAFACHFLSISSVEGIDGVVVRYDVSVQHGRSAKDRWMTEPRMTCR